MLSMNLLLSADDAGPAGALPSDLVAEISRLGAADVAAAGRAAERVARLQAEEVVVALPADPPRLVRRLSIALGPANVLLISSHLQLVLFIHNEDFIVKCGSIKSKLISFDYLFL